MEGRDAHRGRAPDPAAFGRRGRRRGLRRFFPTGGRRSRRRRFRHSSSPTRGREASAGVLSFLPYPTGSAAGPFALGLRPRVVGGGPGVGAHDQGRPDRALRRGGDSRAPPAGAGAGLRRGSRGGGPSSRSRAGPRSRGWGRGSRRRTSTGSRRAAARCWPSRIRTHARALRWPAGSGSVSLRTPAAAASSSAAFKPEIGV